MKRFRYSCLVILIINFFSPVSSQVLSAGYYGGLNFSDIHGNSYSGKWKFKPGPVQGLYVDYSFNKIIGFRTGVSYSTLYYEHTDYYPTQPPYFYVNSSVMPWPYYPGKELTDFSFLTFPAQIRFSVPSVPKLDIMAGIFKAFLVDHNESYYYNNYKPSKEDFGYAFSAALSLPLADKLMASMNAGYMTGRNKMAASSDTRHGSIAFSLGIAMNGFSTQESRLSYKEKKDSISDKVYLVYNGGISVSWNSCDRNKEKYSMNFGPAIGFLININLGSNTSLRTGFSFDRTGYSLKDSSDSFHRYYVIDFARYYVNTKTSADFITIPFLLHFRIGDQGRFFAGTGPYAGIKLNARCKGEAYYSTTGQGSYSLYKRVINDDLEGTVRDNNFGWIFSGGIAVPFFKRLVIESGVQYRTGFGEVFDKSYISGTGLYESGGTIFKNSSLLFQAGIRVPVFR